MAEEEKAKSSGPAPAPGAGRTERQPRRREGGEGGRGGPPGRGGPGRGGPGGGRGGPRGRGGRDGKRRFQQREAPPWEPKTRLGRMVKKGEIKTMSDALATGLPLREAEIVDALLGDLEDEVLDVNMVQRMTDSGRRVRFAITCVVGNKDGFVGLGQVKGKEVGPSIRRAIDRAKMNIIEVKRGAGSWQSGDGAPATSIPFKTHGKCASTEVTIRPAPQGTGLVGSNVARSVLGLAGIEDAWVFTKGQTRTTRNSAKAVFQALANLNQVRFTPQQTQRTEFVSGPLTIKKDADEMADVETLEAEEAAA